MYTDEQVAKYVSMIVVSLICEWTGDVPQVHLTDYYKAVMKDLKHNSMKKTCAQFDKMPKIVDPLMN